MGTGEIPKRVVLEGVPKVQFGLYDDIVQGVPLCACLRACLEFTGDRLVLSPMTRYPREKIYVFLMGMTGAAFRLDWKPGWHGDNVASWLLGPRPGDIFKRAFRAIGYEQPPGTPCHDRAEFKRLLVESIHGEALPVIAHGVIGPPEEAIIAGYDDCGDVAMGWSFFQEMPDFNQGVTFEENGYFRKANWIESTESLLIFGKRRQQPPPRRELYIDALKWILKVVREPLRYDDRHNGLAAYDAWAEHLLRDDEIAAGGKPDGAFDVHDDAVGTVAEGRYYGGKFIKMTANRLPEAAGRLMVAAAYYQEEHDLMWKLWGLVGGLGRGPRQRAAFASLDIRRQMVPIIREARDKDAAAADCVEQALRKLR